MTQQISATERVMQIDMVGSIQLKALDLMHISRSALHFKLHAQSFVEIKSMNSIRCIGVQLQRYTVN